MKRHVFILLLAAATLSTLPVVGRPLSDCTHAARLEVAGYAGTETLTGVPVLVRISESIPGFHYADCGANGAGLVFCDATNEVVFPHEIDEWNPDGESLVWVRLPEMTSGTAFQMGWGGTAAAPDPHAVWSDYAGVWHMNEASGNKLVFGVEIYSLEGDFVSFMEESQQVMFEELEKLRGILRENHPTGTFGIAIHDVGHWESLKRWTNPPEETVVMMK